MIGSGFVLLWMVVAFFILRFIGIRVFAETGRAEIAAAAVVVAFTIGAIWPFSERLHTFTAPEAASPTAAVGASAPVPSMGSAKGRNISSRCPDAVALASGGFGSVDIAHAIGDPTPINTGVPVSSDAALIVEGWAASLSRDRLASAVCLIVDGRVEPRAVVTYGGARPDVAAAFHSSSLGSSAFQIVLPGHALSPGNHELEVVAESGERGFNVIPGARTITFR